FFQAEDGIRDSSVTGVQTCALPIFAVTAAPSKAPSALGISKLLKNSESASLTRSMLAFCVGTMATGPVKGVMPPPAERCMVTPKIGRASCRERVQAAVGTESCTQRG